MPALPVHGEGGGLGLSSLWKGPPTLVIPFDRWLREVIEDRDMTQQQLADEVGVSHQAVSLWLAGVSRPGYDTLVRLVKVLGELPPELKP